MCIYLYMHIYVHMYIFVKTRLLPALCLWLWLAQPPTCLSTRMVFPWALRMPAFSAGITVSRALLSNPSENEVGGGGDRGLKR